MTKKIAKKDGKYAGAFVKATNSQDTTVELVHLTLHPCIHRL